MLCCMSFKNRKRLSEFDPLRWRTLKPAVGGMIDKGRSLTLRELQEGHRLTWYSPGSMSIPHVDTQEEQSLWVQLRVQEGLRRKQQEQVLLRGGIDDLMLASLSRCTCRIDLCTLKASPTVFSKLSRISCSRLEDFILSNIFFS